MECHIAKIADKDLAAIFKYLPPFERLIVSEVCSKWRDISQTPWRDVTRLDLSQVPTQNIHAIIKKCPSLSCVSAKQQNLGDLGRFVSRLGNVASLKCIDCTFTIDHRTTNPEELFARIRQAPWKELVWHNCRTMVLRDGAGTITKIFLPVSLPSALQRFQLSGLHPKTNLIHQDPETFNLSALQAFIVTELQWFPPLEELLEATELDMFLFDAPGPLRALAQSEHLREVYLEHSSLIIVLDEVLELFRHVEILFLDVMYWPDGLERWMMEHRTLRILVITGSLDFDEDIVVPVRKLFPNGFHAQPVPQLHLFLGKVASRRLRFHPSPTDALKIYPIDAPLPEFLEKEEIKPIFKGSWIAERIKEGAKEGVNWTDYSFDGNAESISYVQP